MADEHKIKILRDEIKELQEDILALENELMIDSSAAAYCDKGEIKGEDDGSGENTVERHQRPVGMTDPFRRSFDYVKNSSVGKFLGSVKDEIKFSANTTKEALKKPETRKRRLINHTPEFLTIGSVVYYGVADVRYYSDSLLAKLAKEGLTTNGTYTTGGVRFPLLTAKPCITPAYIPRDLIGRNGDIPPMLTRKLSPFENDYVGFAMRTIPVDVKYDKKGIEKVNKHFKKISVSST